MTMKQVLQAVVFVHGYFLAALFGWRDKTWTKDARTFIIAGQSGHEYQAPDGDTNYRFVSDIWHPEDAYKQAELNADLGQRLWAKRASDDDLVHAIARNRRLLAEWEGNKEMASWMDQEYQIFMSEVNHRTGFKRSSASEGMVALVRVA